ncbi:MAG: DNA primase catalytic subunit PriS, partial [Methanoregula sp.]|nr:DNA primase catalytic subunit PriS [Methanoregula sp.]
MRGPYDLMLKRVKEETEKLLSMLTDEFGIDPKTIEIVFSGGRGYHIHVKDIAFRSWGSAERRELIDYVCGIGIDPGLMLSKPAPSHNSWQARYSTTLVQYLQWLGTLPHKEALTHLATVPGIGRIIADDLMKQREGIIDELKHTPAPAILKKYRGLTLIVSAEEGEFHSRLLERAALADEPVTTDTKRLIRMPTSLHGGSGMRVQQVEARN